MGFLDSLLKGLLGNSNNYDSMDAFALRETMKRAINNTPLVENANSKKNSAAREEFAAITGAAGLEALEIRDGMSKEEIEVTKKCIEYREILKKGGLSKEDEKKILDELKAAKQELIKVRKVYDNAGQYVKDTIARANQVLANPKSPKYISEEKKRNGIFKSLRYGKDDPFFDTLKEIYGDEGLEGYRRERIGLFKNISDDDVKLASERYKREKSPLTYVKTLAQLAISAAAFVYTYPAMLEIGASPIIAGIGYLAISELIKLPEIHRNGHNFDIFLARIRIAKDLGLIDKDKKSADIEKENYK